MGWFDDMVEDVGNAFEDAAEAVGNAVDDVVDFVGDAIDTVVDTAGNVVESVVGTVTGTVESIVDLGQTIGDIASGEEGVDALGNWFGETADRIVFDPIDTATGGAIDVDYAEGSFSAGLDFGVATVGVSVGEDGFEAEAGFDIGIASGDIGFDSELGFSAGASLGAEFLPLPYLEGHVEVSRDGDVFVGGELQANLPGLDLDASGEFVRDSDGSWSLGGEVNVADDLPFVDFDGHAGAAVGRNDDGDAFLHGEAGASVAGPAGLHASADGSVDVVRGDGETLVDVFGEAEAGVGRHEVGVAGGSHAEVSDAEIVDGIRDGIGAVGAAVDAVGDRIGLAVDAVGDRLGAVGDRVGAAAGAVGDRVGDVFDAVGNRIGDLAEGAAGAAAGAAEGFDPVGTGNVVVQDMATDASQAMNTASNVSAEYHETADGIVDNIAGVADADDGSAELPTVEVEQPIQDFVQEIAAADAVADTADDVWDGLDD